MTAPPNRITGYRSKAINAVRDFAVATAPVAGAGLASSDTPGGRVLSLAGDGRPPVRQPWQVEAAFKATSSAAGEWLLRVYAGLAVQGGSELAPPEADGADTASGLFFFDLSREDFGGESGYLVVAAGEDGWELRREEEAAGDGGDGEGDEASGPWRAIAWIDWPDGAAPQIRQLDLGVVDLGDDAIHFGDAEDASALDSWSVDENTPAILDIGGDDWRARILIDSRGNIISYNVGDEDTPAPTPPRDAPLCGNPLNVVDDQHPLGNKDGGGGGGGKAEDDDYNPLNYEGDGGFTPTCGGEAA